MFQELASLLGKNITSGEKLQMLQFLVDLPSLIGAIRQEPDGDAAELVNEYQQKVVRLVDDGWNILYAQIVIELTRLLIASPPGFRYVRTVAHFKLEKLKSLEQDKAKYEKDAVYLDEPCPNPKCGQRTLKTANNNDITRADEGGVSKIVCDSCPYVRYAK